MKKKFLFILILKILFPNSIYAQNIVSNPNKKDVLIGLQTRVIDLLPFEFSLIVYKKNHLTYSLNLGANYFKKNNFGDVSIFNSGGVNYSKFKHSQDFKALYLKGGILLLNRPNDKGENFLKINSVWSFAIENFDLTTEDKIYGKVTRNFKEENIYSGLELEYLKIFNSGISVGGIIGYKLINTIPFKNIVQGLENASTFSPGLGFGKTYYYNISIGYYIFKQ